jgi:uncharacterized protein YbgA (DUF1722 family)/uncharacterized protein YbbK (DUF523 family)
MQGKGDGMSVIHVGVSSCLLGEQVRYDGGHKHDRYITDVLGKFFHFVPVCPEVDCGMSTPREAMRLVGDASQPKLITIKTGEDKTPQMLAFCERKVKELEKADLCGFIFKKDSPSSGLFRVKVYNDKGMAVKNGSGLFANAVAQHFPLLPLEEEGRLNDLAIRENFIERVFSYRRFKDFLVNKPDVGKLVAFHTQQKLLMMAHSPTIYAQMGRLVAQAKAAQLNDLLEEYEVLYMKALSHHATPKKNANALMHVMGYFKKWLSAPEKKELLDIIEQYRGQLVPLIVPITLLKHYVSKYDQTYLKDQVYLSPHPAELMLRNHV